MGGGGGNSYAVYMFSVLTADGGITVMLCTCSDSRNGWGVGGGATVMLCTCSDSLFIRVYMFREQNGRARVPMHTCS